MKTMLAVSLFAIASLCSACDDKAKDTTESAPSKTASSTGKAEKKKKTSGETAPGGSFTITWDFAKLKDKKVEIGQAWAKAGEDALTIVLISKTAKVEPCDMLMGGKFIKTADDVGLELSTSGTKLKVPYEGKPGKYEHVGYTVYYLSGEKGTNSGNSARDDLKTVLEVESIDANFVKGKFEVDFDPGKASGNFVAKICK